MKSEYKRDINGNYLVLYENEEPDTSSYQMRMLVGNSIPSILKCRVQGVDGQFMVCYDITSKQSLLSLYEEKKMGYEDLQMILGGFVQVMEDMSEYLLNPCRLVLKPEYMYVDVEKRQIYFWHWKTLSIIIFHLTGKEENWSGKYLMILPETCWQQFSLQQHLS